MAKDFFGLVFRTTRKLFLITLLFLLFSIWFWPLQISFAQTNVDVSAFIDSDVSAVQSTISANPATITADANETSTITVTVNDAAGNPLANKKAVLSSNRGAIDTISPAQANTNVVGEASFTIKSSTPGVSTISAFVDNAVTINNTATVTFKRPPAPTPITVTTSIPPMFGMPGETITLFSPGKTSEENLVEQGVELQLPFAVFILGSIFIISQPILLAIIVGQTIAYRRRDKKIMDQQEEIIEHEENISDKIDNSEVSK